VSREKRFPAFEVQPYGLLNGHGPRYQQHLCTGGAPVAAVARIDVQRLWIAHERVSLVDVNVAHGLPVHEAEVDGLDERAGAHVVQEGVRPVRA
jgi:hypothetical protein